MDINQFTWGGGIRKDRFECDDIQYLIYLMGGGQSSGGLVQSRQRSGGPKRRGG